MDQHQDVRVVICAPGFPASNDDPDKPFLLDHAKSLIDAGLNVTVVSPALGGVPSRQNIEGIDVCRVRYAPRRLQTLAATGSMYTEARGPKGLLALPMIIGLCVAVWRESRRGTTVLYGHWWIPGGLVAAVVGLVTGRPNLVHLHGSDAAITENKIFKAVARWVFRSVDARLAVSTELAAWGEEISARKFDVLPMPLNLDRLPDPSAIPEQGFVLGVGRLVEEKGFAYLIEAIGQLDEGSRPPLTIVGGGPERDKLEKQARRLGVDIHLPGAVSPVEMSDWYRRSRIVSIPSLREGFGLVAAEASAAGRAVVGTTVGALPQIVEHGVSGLLVRPGDSEALAKALSEVNPEWGSRGPAQVAKLRSEQHGEQLRQLCEDLLN